MPKKKKILYNQRPPIKCHGGKWYLRGWLMKNFPKKIESMEYLEGFGGGASLLLNKPRSVVEQVNDLDFELYCLWTTIQNQHERLIDEIRTWSYSADSFQKAIQMPAEDPFSIAVRGYVLRRMSRGGMKRAFAWSERLRGGKPGDQNAWDTMILQLPLIQERVKDVVFTNRDAITLIEEDNFAANTFVYLDPPYVKSTRHKGARKVYKNEMSDKQHNSLLNACIASKAKIMISGYQCPLYTGKLKEWNLKFKPIANHSSQSSRKGIKLESIWTNY